MPTLSFDVLLGAECAPTPTAYFVELLGNHNPPTPQEKQIVMRKLAVHAMRIKNKPDTASQAVPLTVETHEAADLLCDHYTVRVVRKDDLPLAPSELTLALLHYEYARLDAERQREHVVAMPLSALRQLLDVSKTAQLALTSAIEAMEHAEEEVSIADESVATELMCQGLLIPAEDRGHYLLQDVALQ